MIKAKLAYLYHEDHCANDEKICVGASEQFPVEFECLPTIDSIFVNLSNISWRADFLCLDLKHLKTVPNVNYIELIQTLKTLVQCTVCRPYVGGKPSKRNTKIIVIVSEFDDPKEIRAINKIADGLAPRLGPEWDMTVINDYIKTYVANKDTSMPKCIADYLKNSSKIIKIKMKKDEISLTPRQEQIHALIATRGASNKVIAKTLNISESTVKLHVSAILKKYGVKNRTQLVVFNTKESVI